MMPDISDKKVWLSLLAVVLVAGILAVFFPIVGTQNEQSCIDRLENAGYIVSGNGRCQSVDLDPCTDNATDIGGPSLRWSDGYFWSLSVDGTLEVGADSPIPLTTGQVYADSSVATRSKEFGVGLIVSGDPLVPSGSGVASFDLTGGAFENLITSVAPAFSANDSINNNFLFYTAGQYLGYVAEIKEFIDASNVVVEPFGWNADIPNTTFVILPHPVLAVGDGDKVSFSVDGTGNVEIDSGNYTAGRLFEVELGAGADEQAALTIEVDAEGYSGGKAIDILYETGAMQSGDHSSVLKFEVDETGATSANSSAEIDVINLITTSTSNVSKHAMHIGVGFDSAMTVSGGAKSDPCYGYTVTSLNIATDRVNGVAPDGTAFLDSSASNVVMFAADNDYIVIGCNVTYENNEVILNTNSNLDLLETYEYSTGNGTWAALAQSNSINGFQQSGVITFTAPVGWAKTSLLTPGGNWIGTGYYIKITRTRNFVGSPPVEEYFKVYETTSVSDFEIRGDGTIRPVEMPDAAAPNNSLYFSTTQNKLVYKDSAGAVHDLW